MAEKRLRVAKAGDEPATPATVSEAIENGSSRDVLAAMRRTLAKQLDEGSLSSNSVASACTKIQELDEKIRAMDAEREAEEAKESPNVAGASRRSFNTAAI